MSDSDLEAMSREELISEVRSSAPGSERIATARATSCAGTILPSGVSCQREPPAVRTVSGRRKVRKLPRLDSN